MPRPKVSHFIYCLLISDLTQMIPVSLKRIWIIIVLSSAQKDKHLIPSEISPCAPLLPALCTALESSPFALTLAHTHYFRLLPSGWSLHFSSINLILFLPWRSNPQKFVQLLLQVVSLKSTNLSKTSLLSLPWIKNLENLLVCCCDAWKIFVSPFSFYPESTSLSF